MTAVELQTLLQDIHRVRIAVIGDFCLDAYWDLDRSLSEISIETGLATRAVRSQRYSLGGAGNVANNLTAMGVGRVRAFAVVGDDPFGPEMLRLLEAAGIETSGVAVQGSDWSTPVYIKPIESDREQGRIDFGGANRLDASTGKHLIRNLEESLDELDLVIINQQLPHGVHTDELREELASLVRRSSTPFVVDSRSFSDSFDGAFRKLNDREALRLCSVSWAKDAPITREAAVSAARMLVERWQKPVFITRGARGILGHDATGLFEVPGLQTIGRIDTVGAGDSALAGIAAALAAGRGCEEAATLGNFTAGVTIRKLYITGTASQQEILSLGTDPDYVFRPELAEDPRSSRHLESGDIEIITELPSDRRVRSVIFDFDGTVSTLREGWERIMAPLMIRSVLGSTWESAPEDLHRVVAERVRQYIDATTGVQTIVQMQGLVEMVREFGCVPEPEIKDERGYKADYDKELAAMVGARVALLESGEMDVDDFTIKGVLPIIEALYQAGVQLFLASGTDHSDVERESEVLGVARFFEGRIVGSIGDPKVEAKKAVLREIANQLGEDALRDLVTFGDGPVEIRETKKRSGYAIGVATDEPRRFGWNMAKRSRLIRAGSDLVIPDFLQWKKVLDLMGVHA